MIKEYISYKELEKNPALIKRLPMISRNETTELFKLASYDGALSGVCTYNGIPYLFHCFVDYKLKNGSKKNQNRVFALVALAAEDLDYLNKRHAMNSNLHSKSTLTRIFTRYVSKMYGEYANFSFDNNEVVAWYNLYELPKQKMLIQFLKDNIKDHKSCARAKYIAYGLLRDKEYATIENKNRKEFNPYHSDCNSLLKDLEFAFNLYSCDVNKWSKEYLISVLKRQEPKKEVLHDE